jgi:hypothetical protein
MLDGCTVQGTGRPAAGIATLVNRMMSFENPRRIGSDGSPVFPPVLPAPGPSRQNSEASHIACLGKHSANGLVRFERLTAGGQEVPMGAGPPLLHCPVPLAVAPASGLVRRSPASSMLAMHPSRMLLAPVPCRPGSAVHWTARLAAIKQTQRDGAQRRRLEPASPVAQLPSCLASPVETAARARRARRDIFTALATEDEGG